MGIEGRQMMYLADNCWYYKMILCWPAGQTTYIAKIWRTWSMCRLKESLRILVMKVSFNKPSAKWLFIVVYVCDWNLLINVKLSVVRTMIIWVTDWTWLLAKLSHIQLFNAKSSHGKCMNPPITHPPCKPMGTFTLQCWQLDVNEQTLWLLRGRS